MWARKEVLSRRPSDVHNAMGVLRLGKAKLSEVLKFRWISGFAAEKRACFPFSCLRRMLVRESTGA
jgi:hypothetical protein